MNNNPHGPLRVGVGGPVGSGKTALMDGLCKTLRDRYEIAAITNDIYTKWDAEFLIRSGALSPSVSRRRDRRLPAHRDPRGRLDQPRRHRRDARQVSGPRPGADGIRRRQSRRHVFAGARRPHHLRHRCRRRRKIPSKGGPGITRSDLLVINKIDSRPMSARRSTVMERDAKKMRGQRPFVFANMQTGEGADEIARFIESKGGLGG